MNPHLGPDELADLQEGLLDPDRAAEATGHLRACADCRRDDEALRAVRGRLADVAAAGPMPGDVATRLDEALADAGRRDGAWASAATVTITPLTAASSRRTPVGSRVLQAAAAAVVLLAVVAVAISAFNGGGGRRADSAAAGAARSHSGPSVAGPLTVLATGTHYTQSSVAAAVPRLLAAHGPRAAAAGSGSPAAGSSEAGAAVSPAPTGLARLRSGPALADCITALADKPVTPLAVDLATFAGSPAAVIVLPSLDDPASLDVWVVGPGCSRKDDQFRYFVRVARP